ncbi:MULTISPECIES: class E sortase [unclassified Streptomyces]|uniref:class E sortase n=1 Tax=unclassified Streptomyces TaxID=2593676 RepID=UPI002258A30E|nr:MULTISPECIES: class E sortase [unclassified Streptomyces]MCX4990672.1 class E sortase [Streptomyces sp. NBC_00568]MCX5004097.1 class E sortase [Streptomyces sp. NBC_00638]
MRAPGIVHHGTRRRRAAYRRAVWSGAEVLVTVGVVLLLLVVHQVWWTNRQAQHNAERKVQALEREWGAPAPGSGDPDASAGPGAGKNGEGKSAEGKSGAGRSTGRLSSSGAGRAGADSGRTRPRWSQAYAVLGIPRLSLRVPVAEGVSKPDVLNKGYVGHYKGTQQPGQAGNFALAGHRNTHGEPFRYLPRLRHGDTITVETRTAVYTYTVDRTLPQTSPRDGGVIRPVPRSTVRPSYGYSEPGYYITLTTCTPEYTSRYRMAVWGKLTAMRPR